MGTLRTLMLMIAVFFCGMMAERIGQGMRCTDAGGTVEDGTCRGAR